MVRKKFDLYVPEIKEIKEENTLCIGLQEGQEVDQSVMLSSGFENDPGSTGALDSGTSDEDSEIQLLEQKKSLMEKAQESLVVEIMNLGKQVDRLTQVEEDYRYMALIKESVAGLEELKRKAKCVDKLLHEAKEEKAKSSELQGEVARLRHENDYCLIPMLTCTIA